MKWDFRFASSIAAKAQALMKQAADMSDEDAASQEVAGQVYVGDIYSLRDGVCPEHDDGWGKRCYTCESGVPLL